jgi:hypothetical protein
MLLSLSIRFFLGPALMVISSYAVGMRGILLKVAIVQVSYTPFFQLTSVHVVFQNCVKFEYEKLCLTSEASNAGSSTSRNSAICVCEGV